MAALRYDSPRTGESATATEAALSRAHSWKSLRRSFARDFPHHVRLKNTGGWRGPHINAALDSFDPARRRWWTVGDDVSVWGFKDAADAAAFKAWSKGVGIDWSVTPESQITRPPAPPETVATPRGTGWGHLMPGAHRR